MLRTDVKKTKTSSDVYRAVRDKAIAFQLTPGQRINEGSLAKELGVSRTPVREAMQQLVSEKLLRWERNKGFFCRDLDEKEVSDLYEFRKMLEVTATQLVCQRATDEELQELSKLLSDYLSLGSDQPFEVRLKADQNFHERIAELSGNREIVESLRNINQRIYFIRWVNMSRETMIEDGHTDLIDALLKRDENRAMMIMSRHIDCRVEQISSFIREAYGMIFTGQTPTPII